MSLRRDSGERKRKSNKIAVVLPLSGEPYEIRIPGHFTKKQYLIQYLKQVDVFKTNGYEYSDEIELGFYWRNIMTDYKKTARTCIVFRADPWKKTYGPIVILKIQDGNTQFRYDDYRLTDYHKQCFYNLQQQKLYLSNSPSKSYLSSFKDKESFTEMLKNLSQKNGLNIPELEKEGRKSGDTNPNDVNGGKKSGDTSPYQNRKEKVNFSRSRTPSPSPDLKYVWSNLIHLQNFKEKVGVLKELVADERWNYVEEKSNFPNPILFHYLFNIMIKAINYSNENYCVVCDDKVLIDSGLKDKTTGENLFIFIKKKYLKNNLKFVIENFISWFKAVEEEGFEKCEKPRKVKFVKNDANLVFNESLFLELNLTYLYKNHKEKFPKEWKDLPSRVLKLLFEGITADTRKKLSQDPSIAVPAVFNFNNTKLSLQFLIPFKVIDDNKVDFVIACRECRSNEGVYYLGCTVLNVDSSYSLCRTIRKPIEEWLIDTKILSEGYKYYLKLTFTENSEYSVNQFSDESLKICLQSCFIFSKEIDYYYYRWISSHIAVVSFVHLDKDLPTKREVWLSKDKILNLKKFFESGLSKSIGKEINTSIKFEVLKQDNNSIPPGLLIKDKMIRSYD